MFRETLLPLSSGGNNFLPRGNLQSTTPLSKFNDFSNDGSDKVIDSLQTEGYRFEKKTDIAALMIRPSRRSSTTMRLLVQQSPLMQ
jgi:hypothetical protein